METCFLTTTKEIQNSTISRQDYGNNILGQQRITFDWLLASEDYHEWGVLCESVGGNCVLLSNRNAVRCWLLVCGCFMTTLQFTSPWLLSKLSANADFFNLTILPAVQTWHQVTIICSEILSSWTALSLSGRWSTEECCGELVGGAVSRILFSRHCKPARKMSQVHRTIGRLYWKITLYDL